MILGIPTFNQVRLTQNCLLSLQSTVSDFNTVKVVVIDNGSKYPITPADLADYYPNIAIFRNETNEGYFASLEKLLKYYDGDYVGLCHNDILLYEQGWDKRILNYFSEIDRLGLVGFCGANKIDEQGEINNDLLGNFVETDGAVGQFASFTKPVEGIAPAVCLDSMFMMFKREVALRLTGWEKITPYHWFDRFWSMQTLELGYKIGVIGSKISHTGGGTASTQEYKDFIRKKEGKYGDEILYSKTKTLFLEKYSEFLPFSVKNDWEYSTKEVNISA